MSVEIVVNLALARRLDRAEGMANARFVETRARLMPEVGATWTEVAGAYAMFDGVGSPSTQTFGLGLFQMPTTADMEELEGFFRGRGAAVHHDVCPLAGVAVYQMLADRGYRPIELAQVMYRPLTTASPAAGETKVRVHIIGPDEQAKWAKTAAEGWREYAEMAPGLPELMRMVAARQDSPCFLGELAGQPVAAAAYFQHENVALLAGASTIPEWRNRGAQRALLEARLDYAAKSGCDLAMVVAEPGSASQRNAERQGFRIAYTRTKWELKL